jgi:hypothetical protein
VTNASILNAAPVNAAATFYESGSGELISIEQNTQTEALGNLISIEQNVGFIGSGEIISLEQDVILWTVGSGELISIEQQVANEQSGNLISIEQNVELVSTHLTRTGWDATLVIGSSQIPKEQIHGVIDVERTENTAAIMTVTLIPTSGTQDFDFYRGKPVTCDIRTDSGTFRVFTGTVDIPEIDIIGKKITLRCTDRRTERINNQLATGVNSIGYFSSIIFPDIDDTADALEQRLSTIPYSVDFDAYGNYHLTAWAAKATADYVLDDADVFYSTPRVELTSRSNITNKINITFQYRYERLHQMDRNFSWTSPIAGNICLILQSGYSLTFRDMIRAAIQSSGWPLKNDITFVPIWPSGWYGCVGGYIGWSTVSYTGTTTVVKDSDGNPVKDADGNNVTETRITGGTNFAPLYCMGASWTASTRWSQTMTEEYTLSVQAPQSQAQFGTVEGYNAYAAQAEFDASEWEKYTAYGNESGGDTTYYINQDTNRATFDAAVNTALNIAKTTILGTHRDTRIVINRSIWPVIDLQHTVEIDTDLLQGKGKVFKINHSLDIGTGEAQTELTLVLSKAVGSASNSSLVRPTPPAPTVNYPSGTIVLGNHYAEDPTTDAAANWNGYIGNGFAPGQFFRSSFTEQFIVDVPEIPEEIRQEQVASAAATYNVEIPNDDLTVVF